MTKRLEEDNGLERPRIYFALGLEHGTRIYLYYCNDLVEEVLRVEIYD